MRRLPCADDKTLSLVLAARCMKKAWWCRLYKRRDGFSREGFECVQAVTSAFVPQSWFIGLCR